MGKGAGKAWRWVGKQGGEPRGLHIGGVCGAGSARLPPKETSPVPLPVWGLCEEKAPSVS